MLPILEIVHEDEDLLVVNKPADLVCHPTKEGERSSLVGRVRLYLGHAEGRLVNRLDRETSGLVLIAKSAAVAGELGKLFERGAVEKGYAAVVHGHLAAPSVTISEPIGDDDVSAVAIKGCVRSGGAQAETVVEFIRPLEVDGAPYSLVNVAPRTGRKHQIRIHLAHIGHPVVGDKLYGQDETIYLRFVRGVMTADDRRRLILPTHALHAGRLALRWRETRREWGTALPAMIEEFGRIVEIQS